MISLLIFVSVLIKVTCSYNPIPIGSVIVSTTRTISVLRAKEYGGTDRQTIIFTATKNMTIVHTIFDPILRTLYVVYSNTTTDLLYISRFKSMEKLHSIRYQLPLHFNTSSINKFTSFSSDIANNRAFLTDSNGSVTMFSISGAMSTKLTIPSTITGPVRSVGYHEHFNRLFVITDSTVDSCTKLDENNLECCQALPKTDRLRSITFDPSRSRALAYVVDERTGIYEVILNPIGCPVALRPVNAFDSYQYLYIVIHENLYVCSGSSDHSSHNSILTIGNGTQSPRKILFDASIVALHLSYSNRKVVVDHDETCFHGITYHDYRIAVILAAIFGTVMGVLMCFNALFCIDFFMTKQIIRNLKEQIPHNFLEDRWNKLVEEKYAKLALESEFFRSKFPSGRNLSSRTSEER